METTSSGDRAIVLRVGIVLLTLITAAIHFSLLFPDVVFILNALGYLALLAALYAPVPALESYRPLVRWAFIGYTALTVLLWLIMGERSTMAYVDKVVEVALIVLLLLERGVSERAARASSK